MPAPYKKQQEGIPTGEKQLTQNLADYLNSRMLPNFEKLTGVSISKPGDKAPKSGDVPMLFVLDEKDPAHPKTLEEANTEVGSMLFWELAQKGKLFAYPMGQKEPVQIQAKIREFGAPELSVSEPLSTQPDKLASRSFKYDEEEPEYKRLPPAKPAPGFWASIAHRINSNWYKKEFDAYESNRQKREQISEENRKKKAAYEQRKEQAKQSISAACQAVSNGLETAFGSKRTKAILTAERETLRKNREERERAEKQAELDADAASAKAEAEMTEDRIGNMVSIYGTKPAATEKLTALNMYNVGIDIKKNPEKNRFNVLKPIELPKDLHIGEKPVDDRLFANLAIHAQLTPEIAQGLKPDPDEKQKLMAEGLTEKEAEGVLVYASGGMIVADFLSYTIRPDLDQHFEKRTQPGRERAEAALLEYKKGNKAPLAEIIVGAAEYMSKCTTEDELGRNTMIVSKLTGELLDLLDEDPELEDAAREKGLTDKMVENCRGMDAMRELQEKSLKAEEKLKKAVAEHRELPKEEKTQCLKDIFKFRTASAVYCEQAADYNGKNYMKVKKDLLERKTATEEAQKPNGKPLPEGMKPLSSALYAELTAQHFRPKLFRTPTVISELANSRERAKEAELDGVETEPDNLDKIAEMTVNGLRLEGEKVPLAELDTRTLSDQLTGKKRLEGKALLGEQGKLMAAQERDKREQEAAEKALNETVVYDKDGEIQL